MITKLDFFPEDFLGYDVFATKIECDFLAYSTFSFAQFFKVLSGQKTSAIISFIDGFMCVSAKDCEYEELKQFVLLLNPKGFLCDSLIAEKLNICGKNLFIMERTKKGENADGFLEQDSATTVFNELNSFANGELKLPARDNFISDFSFKQRRKLSLAVSNGKAVAAAFSVGKLSAYIGAVATDKNYRNNHYASQAVESLIFKLNKNKVYLFCEETKTDFYKKLHFRLTGQATIVGE